MTDNLVKSAARTLEIFEAFAAARRRMNSAELVTVLGYPKSSLSVLLRSLVAQGYLSTGPDGDYFPTLKLARLGEWVPNALLGSEALLQTLDALRDRTGETVTLTIAVNFHMRCLYVANGTHPISFRVEEGVTYPMFDTAVGVVHLATQSDAGVKKLFDAWATQAPGRTRIFDAISDRVAAAREAGFATSYDSVDPDTGAIAMPIHAGGPGEVLVVCVAGLARRIEQSEGAIIKTMRLLLSGIVHDPVAAKAERPRTARHPFHP